MVSDDPDCVPAPLAVVGNIGLTAVTGQPVLLCRHHMQYKLDIARDPLIYLGYNLDHTPVVAAYRGSRCVLSCQFPGNTLIKGVLHEDIINKTILYT